MKNKLLIALAVALALLASCTSAPKHLAKAIAKDEPYVAGETRRLWPCITTKTSKPDSTAYWQYLQDLQTLQDFYNNQEPPQSRIDSFETVWTDSTKIVELQKDLRKQKGLYNELLKKCKDNPPIHDTTFIEDSAKIYRMQAATDELQASNDKLTTERDDYKAARNKWRKWFWWTWGILAAGGVLWVLRKRYF